MWFKHPLGQHVLLLCLFLAASVALLGCERRERSRGQDTDVISTSSDGADDGVEPETSLEWISTDGARVVDSAGREVLLRGVITLTHYNRGQPVEYGPATYERMASLGVTYQSIRLYADPLGALGDAALDEEYVARVDQMIADAAAAGIYSQLKLTVYDTTAGRIENFDEDQWAAFWQDDAQQSQWIEAWARLWERYRDDPAVVGYDLLNEPKQGSLGITDEAFEAQYLSPFYQRAIARLREIDERHLVYVQPALVRFDAQADRVLYDPFDATLDAPGMVYAPHFYVTLRNYTTDAYAEVLEGYAATAQRLGVPLLIGEFGLPWPARNDGSADQQRDFQATEQAAHSLFDEYRIGYSRPWYADDRASLGPLNWAMFPGRRGLEGEPRSWITDPLASPYPFRTAGQLTSLHFDFEARQFEMVYAANPSVGPTVLVIPLEPYYPGGFRLTRGDGLAITVPASGEPQIEGVEDPAGIQWHAENGRLSIPESSTGEMQLAISPLE